MKPVLFASVKPLERAENIRAVYEAFDGPKEFVQTNGCRRHGAIRSGAYDLMVIDEFPSETPGKCIMIWHAIQGGKYIGIDQPYPYYAEWQKDLMTCIVTSGHGAVPMFARCSGLPEERVLPLGMPRTDAYIGKRKGDGQTVLADKRAYLYVPTFRTNEETPFPEIDWEWLDDQLTDDEMIAVKAHTMTGSLGIGRYRHIIEIPSAEPSAPYLIDCDAVVTDYSSILFDGYLLGKPGVLFEKRKGYTETRGMYLEYPEQYCSRYCTDETGLLYHIRAAVACGLRDTERACINLVADCCDGHATERVCELIRQLT